VRHVLCLPIGRSCNCSIPAMAADIDHIVHEGGCSVAMPSTMLLAACWLAEQGREAEGSPANSHSEVCYRCAGGWMTRRGQRLQRWARRTLRSPSPCGLRRRCASPASRHATLAACYRNMWQLTSPAKLVYTNCGTVDIQRSCHHLTSAAQESASWTAGPAVAAWIRRHAQS
jgi:hypothetical protein